MIINSIYRARTGDRRSITIQVIKIMEYASITNKGDRSHNEDAIGVFSHKEINGLIVCDGLGGHGMGEVASSVTVDVFGEAVSGCSGIGKAFYERFFEKAQSKLLNEQKVRNVPNKIKTTAAALIFDGKRAYTGHIGDSRVYVFNQSSMIYRTFDHSVPEALRRAGIITESEIRYHSDRNKLLKVLGASDGDASGSVSDEIDLDKVKAFLLCSDGFWEHISEEKMCEFLCASHSPGEWIDSMTKEVIKNGEAHNMDNYSAIAVWKTT